MIEEIAIRGLGVIESAEVRPGAGFTALTGETGAGKTMILTAVALLMGSKAPTGLVRRERARVEGRLSLTGFDDVAEAVADAGGEVDDGELIISRSLPAQGRARAFAGGASVPAGTLADLTAGLIAVHGQSEQLRIRQSGRQRALLDAFAGADFDLPWSRYRAAYDRHQQIVAELSERSSSATVRAAEADLLRHDLDEIAALDPQPEEDALLRAEDERLANVTELVAASDQAHAVLSDPDGGDDALARVGAAVRLLDRAGGFDGELAGLAGRLREAGEALADVAADLASYASGLDADPARLAAVQSRRAALGRLTRKHGPDIDDVLAWAAEQAPRLADLDSDDRRIAELAEERDEVLSVLADEAGQLSSLRARAAAALAEGVTAELRGLAMPDAELTVRLTGTPDPAGLAVAGHTLAFGPDGVDTVEFLLRPHRGADPAPIGVGASGGELSRVMLALEVALAGADAVPTMIFDEVDAGVGGKAAVEIGRRLARLAHHVQVIVVTHLPQVAAFADTHLVVTKDSSGAVTESSVAEVVGSDRARELARMLAGQEDSGHALAHAEELLTMGAQERA
ncbi:MAG: DNA repair protein RecN [Candidatus Nanopelagicales bacterium]